MPTHRASSEMLLNQLYSYISRMDNISTSLFITQDHRTSSPTLPWANYGVFWWDGTWSWSMA